MSLSYYLTLSSFIARSRKIAEGDERIFLREVHITRVTNVKIGVGSNSVLVPGRRDNTSANATLLFVFSRSAFAQVAPVAQTHLPFGFVLTRSPFRARFRGSTNSALHSPILL